MNLKKNKILNYAWALLLVAAISSCNLATLDDPIVEGEEQLEEEEDRVTGPDEIPALAEFETLLHGDSAKIWAGAAFTLAGFDGFQDCRLDDVMTVNADGTYTYDGGNDLCGAEDNERTRTGTWRILNDGNNILFDEGTERQYEADVVGLVSDTIRLSGDYLGLEINGLYISQ